jgi:NAD-dependent dihydropyrimidine dehydrogenase PreA subunit
MNGVTYIKGVTTIKLDEDKCSGCRMCLNVCPHPVFSPTEKKVEILEPDLCIECGACVMNCPEGALSVHPGVGCASAILIGWIKRSEPDCCC